MVTKLLEGHSRFRREYFEHERELFETLAAGAQRPTALMLACNMVPPFGNHLANRSVGAAIEYAVHFLQVPHIIVCGHTQCGGLHALAEGPEKLAAETPTLAGWLQDALAVRERIQQRWPGEPAETIARQLVFENVVVQLENLLTYPVIQRALEENRVEIHGWVYDLAAATLRVYVPEANEFRPVREL